MARTEEKREEVHRQIVATPRILVCTLTQTIPTLSCIRMYRTLEHLHLHPYQVQTRQELKPMNLAKRVHFCDWFLKFKYYGTSVLDNVFFGDETWAHKGLST